MRFQDKTDYYLDINTGLEWSKENFGPISWNKAIKQFDGSNGWRLPTIGELKTLVEYTKLDPATYLPKMLSAHYWSSSTYANYSGHACYVNFYRGRAYSRNKSNAYYIRAVRAAEGPAKKTEEDAIQAWNTRHSSKLIKLKEELKNVLWNMPIRKMVRRMWQAKK